MENTPPELNTEKASLLYDAASSKFELGSKEDFIANLNNAEKRRSLYESVKPHFENVGETFYDFEDKLFEKKKEQEKPDESSNNPQPLQYTPDDRGLAGPLSKENVSLYKAELEKLTKKREEIAERLVQEELNSTSFKYGMQTPNYKLSEQASAEIAAIDTQISNYNKHIKRASALNWMYEMEKSFSAENEGKSYVETTPAKKIFLDYLKETSPAEYEKYSHFSMVPSVFDLGAGQVMEALGLVSSAEESSQKNDYEARAMGATMVSDYLNHKNNALSQEMKETFGEDYEKLDKYNQKTDEILDLKVKIESLDDEYPEQKEEFVKLNNIIGRLDDDATKALAKLKRAEGRLLPKKETGDYTDEHDEILKNLALDYNQKAILVNQKIEELEGNEYFEKYSSMSKDYNDRLINRRNYLEGLSPNASKMLDESATLTEISNNLLKDDKQLQMHPHFEKMQERKEHLQKRLDDYNNGGFFENGDEYVGSFVQPAFKVAKGLLESAFIAEQAFGDSEGYSWAEQLYDMSTTNTFVEDLYHPDIASVAMYSEVDGDLQIADGKTLSMKASNAVGNLATFMAGGTVGKVGVAASAYLMQIGDNYRDAIEAGMSRQHAAIMAEVITGASAGIEVIVSEADVFSSMNKSFRQRLFEQVAIRRAAGEVLDKAAIRSIGRSIYKDLAIQIPKNALGEGFEELTENVTVDMVKSISNHITRSTEGIEYYDPKDIGDVYAYAESFTTGMFTGTLVSAAGGARQAYSVGKMARKPETVHPRLAGTIVSIAENEDNLQRIMDGLGDNEAAKAEVMKLVDEYKKHSLSEIIENSDKKLSNEDKFVLSLYVSDIAELTEQRKKLEREGQPQEIVDKINDIIAAKQKALNEIVSKYETKGKGDAGTTQQENAQPQDKEVQQEPEESTPDGGREQEADPTDRGDTTVNEEVDNEADKQNEAEQEVEVEQEVESEAKTEAEPEAEDKPVEVKLKRGKKGEDGKTPYSFDSEDGTFTVSRADKGKGWKITGPDGNVIEKRFKNLKEAESHIQGLLDGKKEEGKVETAKPAESTKPTEPDKPAEPEGKTEPDKQEEADVEAETELTEDGEAEVPTRSDKFADAARLALESGKISVSDIVKKLKVSKEDAAALLQELEDAGVVDKAFIGDKEVKNSRVSKVKSEAELEQILSGNNAKDNTKEEKTKEQKQDEKVEKKRELDSKTVEKAKNKPLSDLKVEDIMIAYPDVYELARAYVKEGSLEADDMLDFMKQIVKKRRENEAPKSKKNAEKKAEEKKKKNEKKPKPTDFLQTVKEALDKLSGLLKDRSRLPELTVVGRRIFDTALSINDLAATLANDKALLAEYLEIAKQLNHWFERRRNPDKASMEAIKNRISEFMNNAPPAFILAKIDRSATNLRRALRNKKPGAVKATYAEMAKKLNGVLEQIKQSDSLEVAKKYAELQNIVLESIRGNHSVSQQTFDARFNEIVNGKPEGKAKKEENKSKSEKLDNETGKDTDAKKEESEEAKNQALQDLKDLNMDLFNDADDSLDIC